MLLIDFSYLVNRILQGQKDAALKAAQHLNFGTDFALVESSVLVLYNALPRSLQDFVVASENPQQKKNNQLINRLRKIIPLSGYDKQYAQ